ncbi:MAG: T9SS type A sorting domain-containing protein, partial [Chitinophagaceae bacterium]|nr:T9SS type A sorting domain-containing protein [Chitinophagaceae bacterium]
RTSTNNIVTYSNIIYIAKPANSALLIGDNPVDTSRQQFTTGINLKLFPNPAKDLINASISGGSHMDSYTVSIFSAQGIEMSRKTVTGTNIPLDISSLPAGVYIVQLTNGPEIKYQRFIKQ